jgi:hypothetical protein
VWAAGSTYYGEKEEDLVHLHWYYYCCHRRHRVLVVGVDFGHGELKMSNQPVAKAMTEQHHMKGKSRDGPQISPHPNRDTIPSIRCCL